MNIRKWSHPTTGEVRYYFDTKFGGASWMTRDGNALLAGRWIGAADCGDGTLYARIYAKPSHGVGKCRTEDGPHLDSAFFGERVPTWEVWEAIFQSCLTKSGNFSEAKYRKL